MTNRTIYGMYGGDLLNELQGKSITNIDGPANRITLNDGTVLDIMGTADCCAWYEAHVYSIDLTDNIITDVRTDPLDGDGPDSYTLTIISADKTVAAVDVTGDSTSGYYVHGVDLRVTMPDDA